MMKTSPLRSTEALQCGHCRYLPTFRRSFSALQSMYSSSSRSATSVQRSQSHSTCLCCSVGHVITYESSDF